MNSINLYADPGLDGLVESRAQAHRRARYPAVQQLDDSYNDRTDRSMVSQDSDHTQSGRGRHRGYSDSRPQVPVSGLSRSFSQRSRNKQFLDEALLDEDLRSDTSRPKSLENRSHRRNESTFQPIPTYSAPQTSSAQATRSVSDGQQNKGRMIRDNIRTAAGSVKSPKDAAPVGSSRSRGTNDNVAAYGRGEEDGGQAIAPAKDALAERGPLQRLEAVYSRGQSKEEKRARVQEAERLYRLGAGPERKATREMNEPQVQLPQPQRKVNPGLPAVQNVSMPQRTIPQPDTSVRLPQLNTNDLNGGEKTAGRGQISQPTRTVTIGGSAPSGTSRMAAIGAPSRSISSSYAQPNPVASQPAVSTRSVSATQPRSEGQILDEVAPPVQYPSRSKRISDDERTLGQFERNASHRAALARLEGTQDYDAPARSASKSDYLPEPAPSIGQNRTRFDDPIPHETVSTSERAAIFPESITRQGTSLKPASIAGAPLPQTVPLTASPQPLPDNQSNKQSSTVNNPPRPQKRTSSVSFLNPYDRRRPVDEWKAAETARLAAQDFALPSQPGSDDKTWWEQDAQARRNNQASTRNRTAAISDASATFNPRLFLRAGPLLRYTGIKRTVGAGAKEYWRGTIMIVTQDSQSDCTSAPALRLFSQPKSVLARPPLVDGQPRLTPEHVDPLAGAVKMSRVGRPLYVHPVENIDGQVDLSQTESEEGLFSASPPLIQHESGESTTYDTRLAGSSGEHFDKHQEIRAVRLYADPDRDVTFWIWKIEVQLGPEQQHIGYRINNGVSQGFWVPAEGHTMNIMFHSCNGFSASVDPDLFSGPDPLWRDVLNAHQVRPFHVMIGGGDQIYNDKAMYQTEHFRAWTTNKNPHYKHNAAFTPEMREELESFYLHNYCLWFSSGFFSMANAQIPMVNMWDDHDIIDGFGSYPHAFMQSPVFSGVGNIAWKYYMLFQQQSVKGMGVADEPSWILGYKPGPYIHQPSRSIFVDLGKAVALLALDCRTERMKDQVLSMDTLDLCLERCRKEIVEGSTKHLIVLLGIPIAYPRMNWLENLLTSRAMDPVKALSRYGVYKGGLINKFDGGVEILDDLDDHWTARGHKVERNDLIRELQDLAAERSVRVTILGGDVHLAAIGQFYSNPKLRIPKDRDHRYMPNVISSAIVNTPPPNTLADVLNKRNKIHHLDEYTDEDMIPMFTHDVDMKKRNNKRLLPRRNWCSITEYTPGRTPPTSRAGSPVNGYAEESYGQARPQPQRRLSLTKNDLNPRQLFRRISSRNAPPSSYPEQNYDDGDVQQRSASFDDASAGPPKRSLSQRLGMGRRTTSQSSQAPSMHSDFSDDHMVTNKPQTANNPLRPGIHRRATNMSERAAKKGLVPAVDAEGNEIQTDDHLNLEGGLDIVLNVEVDQKDPTGITEPYRLLVPALWYDGSSDREKINRPTMQRGPSMLGRLGIGSRKNREAGNQGAGNWGQDMSETESYTGSEGEYEEEPKKKLGFLGSFRRNKNRQQDMQYDEDPVLGQAETQEIRAAARPMSVITPRTSNGMNNQRGLDMSGEQKIDAFVPRRAEQDPVRNGEGARNPQMERPRRASTHSMVTNSPEPGQLSNGGVKVENMQATYPAPRQSRHISTSYNEPVQAPSSAFSTRDPAAFNRPPTSNQGQPSSRDVGLTVPETSSRQAPINSGRGLNAYQEQLPRQNSSPAPIPSTIPFIGRSLSQRKQSQKRNPGRQSSGSEYAPEVDHAAMQEAYQRHRINSGGNREVGHAGDPNLEAASVPVKQLSREERPQYMGSVRRPSYTISNNSYDADGGKMNSAAHQRSNGSRAVSGPPSSYATQAGPSSTGRTRSISSASSNQPSFVVAGNKQEPVIGIGTIHDAFSGNPQQRALRGHGLIGNLNEDYQGEDRQQSSRNHHHHHHHGHHGHHNHQQQQQEERERDKRRGGQDVNLSQPQNHGMSNQFNNAYDMPSSNVQAVSQQNGHRDLPSQRQHSADESQDNKYEDSAQPRSNQKSGRRPSIADRARGFIHRLEGKNRKEESYDGRGYGDDYSDGEGSYTGSEDEGEYENEVDRLKQYPDDDYNHMLSRPPPAQRRLSLKERLASMRMGGKKRGQEYGDEYRFDGKGSLRQRALGNDDQGYEERVQQYGGGFDGSGGGGGERRMY